MEIFDDDMEILDLVKNGFPTRIYHRNNHFNDMDNLTFFRRFRLTKPTVLHVLEQIEDQLEYPDDRNNAIAPINQLLTCLRYYETGGHLSSCADFLAMAVSSTSRTVEKVSEVLAGLRPRYVEMPTLEHEDGADAEAVEENENAYNTQNDNEDLPQTQNQEVYAEENSGTINQKTTITPRKKRKCDESKCDLLVQKAERALNEDEDQYDIYGKYVTSEMRNLSHEYLRKKMERKFQQIILVVYEEEERLSTNVPVYSNPPSVSSFSSNTDSLNVYTTSSSPAAFPANAVTPNYASPAAEYLQTETERSLF